MSEHGRCRSSFTAWLACVCRECRARSAPAFQRFDVSYCMRDSRPALYSWRWEA